MDQQCYLKRIYIMNKNFIKKTRDDEIKNLKYQTENHEHENILKPIKIDNE